MQQRIDIVVLGLCITSSWGNGHATTYRALIKGLKQCGHRVLFLERDQPWYASHRDMSSPNFCDTRIYSTLDELEQVYTPRIRSADLVIVGSYVPDGVRVCRWVLNEARGARAFYDIDTPVTLAKLAAENCTYLTPRLIPEFDLFLSFTGGPVLKRLQEQFGARRAEALYCSVDADEYFPEQRTADVDLGYMGTYSADRQPKLQQLLVDAAVALPERKFAVVGPQYPSNIHWPHNVARVDHLPPAQHRSFYNSQRYTLNVTRADMVSAGYSPSVRLFEAAACGVPIISDRWNGIETLFTPGEEILLADGTDDVLRHLTQMTDAERHALAARAREKVLQSHTGVRRAAELEGYLHTLKSYRAASAS